MMRLLLLYSCSIFLVSCTQDCPEQKVKSKLEQVPASNKELKVDVPKASLKEPNTSKNVMTVSITKNDVYIVDGKQYDFDSLEALVMAKLDHDSLFTIIRIEGHKDAHYEAFFKVLTMADKHALKPALAYKK